MATRPVKVPGESADPSASDADNSPTDQAPAVAEKPKGKTTKAPEPAVGSDGRHLRAADVDPTKIARSVLTLDGWVCPAKSPAPAGRE